MRKYTTVGLVAALSLIAAACGDDDAGATSVDDATSEPAADDTGGDAVDATDDPSEADEPGSDTAGVTDAPGDDATDEATDVATDEATDVATEGAPSSIISLSPTATEMLYAIDAGEQVLAVDDFSNHPPEASAKMQGLSGFEPNIEAIAGLEPDLVVTDGTNPNLLEQLDTLGIAHWEGPAATSFDDVYVQLEQLGVATGHVAEATELVAQMQSDVASIIGALPQLSEPLTYYHELDSTFYSVTSETFIGAVYGEMGLVNIADLAGEGLGFYPQLSAEYIISSNPDLIFLACTKYCGESTATVAARPGWDSIDAVNAGGVIEMDDDIASRWGPRIVDYLEIAGAAVQSALSADVVG